MAVTVRDIAKKLNIGKSTVGYALNGGPKPVSEEVRRLVMEAAREMGYRPNETARALAKGRTNMIGVVPFQLQRDSLASPYMRMALAGLYQAAEELGRHIVLFTGYSPDDTDAIRSRSFEARVDGIVLVSPRIDRRMMEFIAEQNLPLAIVAGATEGPGLHFNADNEGGVRAAVEHLAELGHRSIGAITGTPGGDGTERRDAFYAAMTRLNLAVGPGMVQQGDFTKQSGYKAGLRLLRRDRPPTAAFAANDQMAFGLLMAAREIGLRVPQDLSVVGFDDDELSKEIQPPLTTIEQPIAEMAAAALRAVVGLSTGQIAQGRIFATRLIERATTACPQEDAHP